MNIASIFEVAGQGAAAEAAADQAGSKGSGNETGFAALLEECSAALPCAAGAEQQSGRGPDNGQAAVAESVLFSASNGVDGSVDAAGGASAESIVDAALAVGRFEASGIAPFDAWPAPTTLTDGAVDANEETAHGGVVMAAGDGKAAAYRMASLDAAAAHWATLAEEGSEESNGAADASGVVDAAGSGLRDCDGVNSIENSEIADGMAHGARDTEETDAADGVDIAEGSGEAVQIAPYAQPVILPQGGSVRVAVEPGVAAADGVKAGGGVGKESAAADEGEAEVSGNAVADRVDEAGNKATDGGAAEPAEGAVSEAGFSDAALNATASNGNEDAAPVSLKSVGAEAASRELNGAGADDEDAKSAGVPAEDTTSREAVKTARQASAGEHAHKADKVGDAFSGAADARRFMTVDEGEAVKVEPVVNKAVEDSTKGKPDAPREAGPGAIGLSFDSAAGVADRKPGESLTGDIENRQGFEVRPQSSSGEGSGDETDNRSGDGAAKAAVGVQDALKGVKDGAAGFAQAAALEKANATGNATAPSSADAPAAASVFEKVEDGLKLAVLRGGKEVTVSLHPEELGRLRISVSETRGAVTARIVVETQAVKEMMDAGSHNLKELFARQGLTLDRCSVEVGGFSTSLGNDGRADGGRGAWQHSDARSGFGSEGKAAGGESGRNGWADGREGARRAGHYAAGRANSGGLDVFA